MCEQPPVATGTVRPVLKRPLSPTCTLNDSTYSPRFYYAIRTFQRQRHSMCKNMSKELSRGSRLKYLIN